MKEKIIILVNPMFRISRVQEVAKRYGYKVLIIASTKDFSNSGFTGGGDYLTISKEQAKRVKGTIVIHSNDDDPKKLAKIIKAKYQPLVVIPYESSVIYSAKLAKCLKLKTTDPKILEKCKNKNWLNNYCNKNGIKTPCSLVINRKSSVETNFKKIKNKIKTYPMVIKPCGGAAGYGVYITKNDNMLKKYLNEISSVNFINEDEGFCVQEYASGKEMFLNFCTMNGKHILTDAWTYEKIEYGAKTLHCKAKTSMKMTPMLQKCKEYCIKILNLIKYKWGNTHIELKVSDEGIPQLIEVNFRTMGCHTNVLTPIFFNFSTPELAMLTFLNSPLLSKYAGKDVYNKSQKKVQSFFIINSKKEMTIKKLNIESWCKKNLKSFEGFVAEVKTGDHVKESDNLINIIGEVGLWGSKNDVDNDLKKLSDVWKNNYNKLVS